MNMPGNFPDPAMRLQHQQLTMAVLFQAGRPSDSNAITPVIQEHGAVKWRWGGEERLEEEWAVLSPTSSVLLQCHPIPRCKWISCAFR